MGQARLLGVLQTALIATGFFLLGYWFHGWNETRNFQRAAMRTLELRREALATLEQTARREALATLEQPRAAPAPAGRSTSRSADKKSLPAAFDRLVIGRLNIPRLNISVAIVEGTDPAILSRAVGHIVTTALPGEPGNVGLAGHRDTFLHRLGDIRPDDEVLIFTPDSTLRYRVNGKRVVKPDQIDVLDPTPTPSLTLVTCYPFTFVGPAPDRFVVSATLTASEGVRGR